MRLIVGLAFIGFGIWLLAEGYRWPIHTEGAGHGASFDALYAAFGIPILILGLVIAARGAREYLSNAEPKRVIYSFNISKEVRYPLVAIAAVATLIAVVRAALPWVSEVQMAAAHRSVAIRFISLPCQDSASRDPFVLPKANSYCRALSPFDELSATSRIFESKPVDAIAQSRADFEVCNRSVSKLEYVRFGAVSYFNGRSVGTPLSANSQESFDTDVVVLAHSCDTVTFFGEFRPRDTVAISVLEVRR